MQDRQPAFTQLTAEAGDEVLSRVATNLIYHGVQVNKSWATFFTNKLISSIPSMINGFTTTVCIENTLSEIKPKIDWILSKATLGEQKSLYLKLKSIEEEILDIVASPLYRYDDYVELKMYQGEFNQYLIEKFGIAGHVNSWTFRRVFEYNGSEDKAVAFAGLVALQTVLQTQEVLLI